MSKRAIAVAVAATFVGCVTDHRFDTQAIYRAPIGGFDISIHAMGIVRAGADLSSESTADVRIAAVSPEGPSPIEVRVALPKASGVPDVADLVRRAGYHASRAELDELNRVVELAVRGSKATFVQGQTKALQVIDVRFRFP